MYQHCHILTYPWKIMERKETCRQQIRNTAATGTIRKWWKHRYGAARDCNNNSADWQTSGVKRFDLNCRSDMRWHESVNCSTRTACMVGLACTRHPELSGSSCSVVNLLRQKTYTSATLLLAVTEASQPQLFWIHKNMISNCLLSCLDVLHALQPKRPRLVSAYAFWRVS